MALDTTLVMRLPKYRIVVDSSVQSNKHEVYDILSSDEGMNELNELIYGAENAIETFRSAVQFAYDKRGTALGITLLDEPDNLPLEYFSDIINGLINYAAGSQSISLLTKSGYVVTAPNTYAFACFYLFLESQFQKASKQSNKINRYKANMYLKMARTFKYLMVESSKKEEKMFVGSIMNTFKENEETVNERIVYVLESLAGAFSDEQIKEQFEELKNN